MIDIDFVCKVTNFWAKNKTNRELFYACHHIWTLRIHTSFARLYTRIQTIKIGAHLMHLVHLNSPPRVYIGYRNMLHFLHFLHFLHLNASEPGAESVKSAACFFKLVVFFPEPGDFWEEPANFRQKALQKQSKPWTPRQLPLKVNHTRLTCQVHPVF